MSKESYKSEYIQIQSQLKDKEGIIENFRKIQKTLMNQNKSDAQKVDMSYSMIEEAFKDIQNKKSDMTPGDLGAKNSFAPVEIFQETMKTMKLVIDGQFEQGHIAQIYYHDEIKNSAKLLIDKIQLFKLEENQDI